MIQQYPAYKDSGAGWVGEVPEHWRVEKFRWVTKLSNQKNIDDVERPMLSLSAYDGIKFKKYEYETQKRSEEQNMVYMVVKPKQLVVNPMWVMKRSIAVSELDGIVSPAYRVYDISDDYLPKYFHYLMRSDIYVDEYNRHIRGLTTYDRSVRKDDFAQLLVPIPPIEEQEAIVAFLEEQTAVINQFLTNKRRLIELLEEQKQVVINTAVTQGLDTAVPRKPSGIDWLGDIPAHWEIKKIGYIAEVGNGSTPSRSNMRYWQEGTFPWLNSSSVNQGVIVEADQFVTPTALDECHLPIVKPNSILVAITGQGKTRGTAALLTFEATINQHMAYITPLPKVITADYLVTFLQGNYHYLRYISDGQGGTKGALTCGDIKQLKIPIPPPSEQEIIVQRVKRTLAEINAVIERTQREIELIEEYRTTLIAHAVTGKINVCPNGPK